MLAVFVSYLLLVVGGGGEEEGDMQLLLVLDDLVWHESHALYISIGLKAIIIQLCILFLLFLVSRTRTECLLFEDGPVDTTQPLTEPH